MRLALRQNTFGISLFGARYLAVLHSLPAVHALAADGALLAQHDAMLRNDLRPFSTLPVHEDVIDNHGLALPPVFTGTLRLVVGLYDPELQQRVNTTNVREAVTLTNIVVSVP
jgi:hypothetical protein